MIRPKKVLNVRNDMSIKGVENEASSHEVVLFVTHLGWSLARLMVLFSACIMSSVSGLSMVTWTRLTNSISVGPMWLMQDGTVLGCTDDGQTLKFLHPDSKGSYANGYWSDAGKFVLARVNFASAVLPDGRLVVCGGEQSGPGFPYNWTNRCEIYDPFKTNYKSRAE